MNRCELTITRVSLFRSYSRE